jgi:hypothetical protein
MRLHHPIPAEALPPTQLQKLYALQNIPPLTHFLLDVLLIIFNAQVNDNGVDLHQL